MLREEDGGPAATGGAAPLEIVQSRDLTLAEAKAITRFASRYHLRSFQRDPWHWPLRLFLALAFGLLAADSLFFNELLRCSGRDYSFWIIAVMLLFFTASLSYRSRYLRFIALGNKTTTRAGTRHSLDGMGYTIARDSQATTLSWHGIAAVENNPALAMVATSPVHCWPIVKAAFERQDVDAFWAELERRWKAAKGAAHAG